MRDKPPSSITAQQGLTFLVSCEQYQEHAGLQEALSQTQQLRHDREFSHTVQLQLWCILRHLLVTLSKHDDFLVHTHVIVNCRVASFSLDETILRGNQNCGSTILFLKLTKLFLVDWLVDCYAAYRMHAFLPGDLSVQYHAAMMTTLVSVAVSHHDHHVTTFSTLITKSVIIIVCGFPPGPHRGSSCCRRGLRPTGLTASRRHPRQT